MNGIKEQVRLIRQVKNIRSQYQKVRLSGFHYRFLGRFFWKHRWFVLTLIILFLSQGLLEALLIIFSRNQLSASQSLILAPFFWQFLAIFLAFFFLNSFFSIRQEKTLGVWLANSIRRRLFKSYIDRPLDQMTQDKKAELIAKIAYQLPLVSMGLTNSLFGIMRWLIYIVVASLIAFWGGLNWLPIMLAMLALSFIVGVAAYFVARRYISQEVTYYSQIIKEVDINTTEKYFLKNFSQESLVTKRFDNLVDFDSFFRVRRDIWMKMGFKVVFAVLIVVAVMNHFFSQDLFPLINLAGPEKKFLFLFLMIYFSRGLNEGLKIGLYAFPARLGLYLTVVKPSAISRRRDVLDFSQEISFYSRKTKLFQTGPYQRRINFTFARGGRYLFHGPANSGKSALAKLFFGQEAYNAKAWKIKLDGRRLDYAAWQKFGRGLCFFDPNFRSHKTIMEFILGNESGEDDFQDLERALQVLSENKQIALMLSVNGNYNSTAGSLLDNPSTAFALWTIYALVNEPALIMIDNFWLDLNYSEIKEMLQLLERKLPSSTLVVFSRRDNGQLNYQQKYDLSESLSKEI